MTTTMISMTLEEVSPHATAKWVRSDCLHLFLSTDAGTLSLFLSSDAAAHVARLLTAGLAKPLPDPAQLPLPLTTTESR